LNIDGFCMFMKYAMHQDLVEILWHKIMNWFLQR